MKQFIAALPLLVLAACASTTPERGVEAATVVPNVDSWEEAILPEDTVRLGRRAATWARALEITETLSPDVLPAGGAALIPGNATAAVPADGTYRCRTIKLGVESLGGVAYGWFRCRVFTEADGKTWLVKDTGSQRQTGRIFADGTFLGGLVLGDEEGSIGYGAITERNVVGVMERLSDGRYRLVQPEPVYESMLDILELKAA